MNSYSEFSFNAHKELNRNTLRCWNDIKDFKLMWIPEWDMWFEAYVEIDEENEDIKKVTGKSLGEAELSQIMLYNIEINTEADISRDDYKIPTTFYNPDHPEASLVNRLTEKAPHYRFAHIDISLMNIQRTFTFDKKSIYDALKEVAEELNCLFVFGCSSDANGKPERTISVYDLEANCKDCGHRDTFVDKCPKCGSTNVTNGYGEYTNVFISRDNLVEEVTYTTDADSVKNCFKLTAGDDLMTAAIRSCNPNGSDYIYYFSDAVRSDMSEQLQEKLSAYDKLYEEYQKTHNFYIDSSFVNNYNAIVTKYIKYDDSLKKIESPITGYPKLMQAYFDTIDMVQFLKNKLMPNITKPDNSAKSQGEYLMENLPSSAATTSLKNLSVSTANNIMISLAQSIVKGSFKITVTETTLSNDVWRGKFNLKSYSDEDDTYTSSPVSIGINENYEEYVRQRIEKILNKSDDNYYDIVGLFKQDLTVFKSELKKYCLDSLNTFQKCCQSCIDIMVQQGVASDSSTATTSNAINAKAIYDSLYVPYYNKLNAIQDEILVREDEVYTVEGKYNNQNELIQDGVQIEIERIIGDVQDTLNFQKFIGDKLNKEFCAFLRMDEYSNDNYISDGLDNTELFQNAFDFINVATKELYKSATLQHSITGTLKNFLRMREFAPIVNSFKNGNWITIQIDDEIYQLRIIEYTIDFASSQNIDVTFSDVISAKDIASDIKSILDQASNMATSYGSIVRQSDMNSNFSKKMSDMILKGLDMTNTKIVSSADNQDITWDEHGLLCREFNDILNDYNPCQLKIINHGLYITNDGWKTAKAGVGQFYYFDPKDKAYKEGYGIIADTLVGNLILSSQVGIYNEEKSIEMDKNGIIVTTNTYNKNVFTIKKEITDDEGNITYERQLYIDDNGNIVLGGGASISWDNVIGTDKDGKSNSMSKLFKTLNDTLNEKYNYLLSQDDKKAETWYQSGDPSVDWTTDELKARHKGDLWYNTNDQKTYIFTGESWELTKTTPPDDVFDKIDGKAQIFISQPVPPYNVGDLWFDSKTSDIMTCVKERGSGDYVASDWEKRNKYTDDSSLTSFIKGEYAETLEIVKGQIDEKADTWYQETDPSTAWKTADDKKKHIGDLWYDTKNQKTYIYGAKGWEETKTNPPDSVFDKIDGKAQIFVAQPKPPYAVGDLWFNSKTSDIMTCVKARTTGNFDSTDWEKRNKYTDDSSLTDFINNTYTTDIGNIQNQIDGKIETFRQETDPSTAWKTADDKKKHIGDLWYDTKNQKTYIYGAKGWEETKTNPPDSVFDKIDGKAQIFVAQPKPPYAVGDLWFNSKTSDIMTCVKARTTGNFDSTDWEKRNKYTDDSSLTDFINNTYTTDIGNIQNQIDGKIETFRQETDPSTAWKTADDKKKHIGDLWYDTKNQKTYIYGAKGWEETKTNPPDSVFDKIDGKAQIFVAQPKPPYAVGDLWFNSKTSDIMTCVKARTTGNFDSTDWEKRNKYTDDSSLTDFINNTYTTDIGNIQNQIDGKIETFRQETDPSTAWKTADDKKKHIGDLWYDTKNQKTYIYGAKGWEETKTNPPDSVFDKIDGKAQIFVAQPKPPYAVGDLWFNSKTSDIMTCVKARTTGNFDSTDWEKRNKYTDDSSLTDFINNTYTTDIGNIQNQIDGKIETFRQETDPSTAWKTADDKKKHIGDLWYDTATNETFMYNGAGWSPVAGTVPDEVWGKIDSKCQIFTAQPKPPYNKGDLWFVGSSGDILTCTTARKDGESYVETDWTKQNKYTDDTTANTIKNGILKSTYIDSQWVIAPNIKGGQLLISNKSGTISAQITSEGKLIAKEGEFSGKIVSTSGEIGGFNIDNYSLWSGQNVLGGSGVYISPKYGISCNSSFQVTTGGKLTATDADITGDIVALNITAKQDYSIYYTDVSGKPSDSQKIIKALTWGAGSKQIGFGLNMESSDQSDILGMMLYQNTSQSSKRIFLYADDVTVEGQSIFWKEANFYGSVYLKNYADYSANLMVETEGGTIPYRNMKWNPSDKNGTSTGTYFSFNGYGHNHTLLPNSNGTLAIGIGDLSPTSTSPIWCLLPYRITTSTTSYNNQPDITDISRASNGVINLGYYGYDENGRKVDYRFDCVYAKSINIGGKTYTSITGGEKGEKGEPGKAATITIGSVKSGSYADVTNVGTSNAAKLNFVLPKGEKGEPGNASNGGNVNSHLFMKNMNGYKCYSTSGAAVAGMYCNNSNVMFLCDNSYDTILRGSSCRLKSTSGSAITSDIRQKKDFKSLSLYEDFYMDIDTVAYKYKNGKSGRYHVGVKAQQILEALNNNHLSSMDFGGYIEYKVEKDEYEGEKFVPDYDIECGIIYNEFIALNTHMTQKAHRRIDELEIEIKKLKQIINSLQGVA